MITANDIECALFKWAPPSLAMNGDPVGLQAGEREKVVRNVMVTLDVTHKVINEAVFSRTDLIVSHHPIWRDGNRPTSDTNAGSILLTLCQTGIVSIAMHTNLDAVEGGVNDVLAQRLGLTDVRVFDEKDGIGRIGRLPQMMTVKDYASQCKSALRTCMVKYHDAGRPVQNVAFSSGSGGSLFEDAIHAGCDTFVSADLKHYHFLTAQDQAINLLDCGHFATENVIVPILAKYLKTTFPELTVSLSSETEEPFQCL